ncbi:TPA: hypothetical protein DDZ10_03185 [Candidatus Uhrbacteria bacterium]|nr:hypothetical protein [Candidatus Uhrbacteria bacterium]
MSDQQSGPDELHTRLLRDNKRLHQERDTARAEIKRLRTDPRTGFLREFSFIEHLDALLRSRLKTGGAVKLLHGVSQARLSDDEIIELYLSLVIFAPTYPDPALGKMMGIRKPEPVLDEAFATLGAEVRPMLATHELIVGLDDTDTEVMIPKHVAGHLEDRLAALSLVEPPRVSARFAKEATQGIRARTSGRSIADHVLPFRFDYGGAILVEALAAANKFFARFRQGSAIPSVQLEVARRLLLGIARERAENSRSLASAALQARLKHAGVEEMNHALGYLFQGESVLDTRTQDGVIHTSLSNGDGIGQRTLDGGKLEAAMERLQSIRTRNRIESLVRRARDHTGEHPSATELERLTVLSAHNRLDEF